LAIGEGAAGELVQFGLLVLLVVAIWIVGFFPALAVYLVGILVTMARMRPVNAAVYSAVLLAGAYMLADQMLMHLPAGLLFK
jgi:hypothetical protein